MKKGKTKKEKFKSLFSGNFQKIRSDSFSMEKKKDKKETDFYEVGRL